MRFWRRKKPPIACAQLAEAHGRRSYDGSHFCVWLCENGHGEIGEALDPPAREDCMSCWLANPGGRHPAAWRRATPLEAKRFIYEIEGPFFSGFTLSQHVLEAKGETQ